METNPQTEAKTDTPAGQKAATDPVSNNETQTPVTEAKTGSGDNPLSAFLENGEQFSKQLEALVQTLKGHTAAAAVPTKPTNAPSPEVAKEGDKNAVVVPKEGAPAAEAGEVDKSFLTIDQDGKLVVPEIGAVDNDLRMFLELGKFDISEFKNNDRATVDKLRMTGKYFTDIGSVLEKEKEKSKELESAIKVQNEKSVKFINEVNNSLKSLDDLRKQHLDPYFTSKAVQIEKKFGKEKAAELPADTSSRVRYILDENNKLKVQLEKAALENAYLKSKSTALDTITSPQTRGQKQPAPALDSSSASSSSAQGMSKRQRVDNSAFDSDNKPVNSMVNFLLRNMPNAPLNPTKPNMGKNEPEIEVWSADFGGAPDKVSTSEFQQLDPRELIAICWQTQTKYQNGQLRMPKYEVVNKLSGSDIAEFDKQEYY